jgi:hypothetical protein
VTIWECLGDELTLRKLYETRLLNAKAPLVRALSRDGRFFVTLDDFASSGISPETLVIYDLARKEHTSYAGKDFLNEEAIRRLPQHALVAGFKWHGKDYEFNQDSTKFYPTRPENCEEEQGVPFLEIDLRTRSIRARPTSSVDPKTLVQDPGQEWSWNPSTETSATDLTVLPLRITWSGPNRADRVYDLAPGGLEYKCHVARQDQEPKSQQDLHR